MELKKESLKTVFDIERLPEGTRAELIDGVIYDMASPSTKHQELVSFLTVEISLYIRLRGGNCKVFPAPYDVQLDKDDYTLVQPDLSVICDRSKITDKRCVGAPDWVIEIVSPSTGLQDYSTKLFKYRAAGVREYWIVDPVAGRIVVYDFANPAAGIYLHPFGAKVKSLMYPDLEIDFSEM